jgi:CRP/FNR family transcriptional regulator, cyclic AMP receptor protein
MPSENRLGGLLGLSSETRAVLLKRAKIIRVRRGQNLLARGERSSQVYVVVEGRLHVVLYSTSGREVSLRDLSEGDIFGELAAIDGEDRCANPSYA